MLLLKRTDFLRMNSQQILSGHLHEISSYVNLSHSRGNLVLSK